MASLGFQNCGGQPIYTYTPTQTGSGSEVLDPGRSTTDSAESTVVLEHSSTSALSVSLELDAMSTGEERRLYLIHAAIHCEKMSQPPLRNYFRKLVRSFWPFRFTVASPRSADDMITTY